MTQNKNDSANSWIDNDICCEEELSEGWHSRKGCNINIFCGEGCRVLVRESRNGCSIDIRCGCECSCDECEC